MFQDKLLVPSRRLGSLKTEPTGCNEMMVTTYQSKLNNTVEKQRSDSYHAGSHNSLISCLNVYYHNASQKPVMPNTYKE